MIRHALRACAFAALVPVAVSAAAPPIQFPPPDLPPPPNVFASLPEEQLVAQMPERQRTLVGAARNARERFIALTNVSDLQLQELANPTAAPPAAGQSITFSFQLYEATILAADKRLRSKESAVRPRDRLFKRFEQQLRLQIQLLKTILLDVAPEHLDAAKAASSTAKKLRLAALASAIDADPMILRDADGDEE
jgi:hypothetical protein